MDQPPASGGGPAPFLVKTYEMVDDSSTDEIVSWCPDKKNSFVVWNPPEFARLLLPTYFKHNNFSSFIRQLNTYGFRKIDPERWEFSNDEFVKDQKHLLKNIHRRKPIHSHSHLPGSAVDSERVAFEEEIERLLREKAALEANILKSKQQRSAAQAGVEELTQRFDSMKTRQESLLASLEKAVQEPTFVERLARKLESVDISAYRKKRRLPAAEQWKPVAALAGNDILDDDSSARPELGSMFDQDFSNKLRLELSPAISDVNLVSCSTQSSNEDGPCPLGKASERDPEDTEMRIECPLFAPEPLDVSDTGTSFGLKMDSYFPQKAPMDGDNGPQVLHRRFGSGEDVDANVSCQLKLALASSPLRANRSPFSSSISQQAQQIENLREADSNANTTESDPVSFRNNRDACEEDTMIISKEPPAKNQEHTAKPVRVNDVFWEQFLTERPGSSHNEEACSSYRANAYEEQDERRTGNTLKKSYKRLEQLSLTSGL